MEWLPETGMTSKDVLVRARGLLDEYPICRRQYAEDEYGDATGIRDGTAVAYCAVGFLQRAALDVMGTTFCHEFEEAYDTIRYTADVKSLHVWGDLADDDEIRQVFDTAAKAGV
jgi:hypothetical protein